MSVVQRCPSCGTTKATSGECEACHEAQVRYFCTNHTPGLWLDAGTCPSCGARFGEPPREVSAPAPSIPVQTRSPAIARPPARTPKVGMGDSRGRPAAAREREVELDPRASRMALLQKILEAAIRARYMPSGALGRSRRPARRGAGGCLGLLLGMVLLLLALASGAFVFGRTLLLGY